MKKFIRIPANRWMLGLAVALGVVFGNDAVVAVIRPMVDFLTLNMPAT